MTSIKKYFWRGLISLIGVSFILNALFFTTLGIIGHETYGTVTTYRRIMGERGEAIPNRYTFSLGYQFYVNDQKYSGSTTVINSPLFIKPDGNQLIQIKYIDNYPYLNGLEQDTKIDLGKLALVGIGIVLIVVMNPVKRIRKSHKTK